MGKTAQTWKEFWDALATSRDPIAATDRPTVTPATYRLYCTEIDQKLQLNQNDTLLDIGCGTGLIDAGLAGRVRHIYAVDFSPVMAKKARSNTAAHPNVRVVNCDSTALPFKDGVMPKTVMYAVAQYLSAEQINRVLAEARRVAQPGGLVMLGEIPRARDASLAARIRDVWAHQGAAGVIRKLANLSFEFWLRKTGGVTQRFVRPKSLPIILHSKEGLLQMARQQGMRGRVLAQNKDLPWFHQTFDLLVENTPPDANDEGGEPAGPAVDIN